jgi:hypothetical protein
MAVEAWSPISGSKCEVVLVVCSIVACFKRACAALYLPGLRWALTTFSRNENHVWCALIMQ